MYIVTRVLTYVYEDAEAAELDQSRWNVAPNGTTTFGRTKTLGSITATGYEVNPTPPQSEPDPIRQLGEDM